MLHQLLGNVHAYLGLQRALGADRLRNIAIAEAALAPGRSVLDIGCGPAYYVSRLPTATAYYGFDTHAPYLAWARSRWPHAQFHCSMFDSAAAALVPQVDVVLLFGLLHHVSDDVARDLLSLCASKLREGGRVVSVDTAFAESQGRIARWVATHDRGQYVRTPEQFSELARTAFGEVGGRVVDVMRIPTTMWLMTSSRPRIHSHRESRRP